MSRFKIYYFKITKRYLLSMQAHGTTTGIQLMLLNFAAISYTFGIHKEVVKWRKQNHLIPDIEVSLPVSNIAPG